MAGQLQEAVVSKDNGVLRVRCAVCGTDLSGAPVYKREELGIRTILIVQCPRCKRFAEYWRNNRHGV